MDVSWGLPFAAGAARYVYTSHCLEHLYLGDMLRTLREIHRVLADGGLVRIVVPDIEIYARAYVAGQEAFFAERRRVWYWLPEGLPPLMTLLGYAGAGARPADFTDTHKFGYDFATLAFLLRRVGFCEIRRSAYMSGQDEILLLDHHSEVAGASYRDQHYSLFVEATK
ncbi:MAG: class I SAM-dependent methyltransferase [Geminicoccaceae bacterium]